ncbi:MAG: SDR family NAD(P)-dependent oxidoreductase [Alphaproteobacteria bacterium]|nr:MAG: SDR family NAD(P)-dependent oxidoreductase [Alphaproteobacteria bacterium]
MKLLQDKIVLITGASRGIGRAVAVEFARQGARLILTGRDVPALEETDDLVQAAGGEATLVPLDLSKVEMIDTLAAELAKKFRRLDVFVGNAATLGILGPLHDTKPRDFTNVMTVNVHANWRLLRAMHGGLLSSKAGRVIFTTSGVTEFNPAYWGAYNISKSALESLAHTYANEVASTNIRVNLVDPGAVRTQMRAEAFPGENPMTLPPPESIAPLYVQLALDSCTSNGKKYYAHKDIKAA